MIVEQGRPFANLITGYAVFRQQLEGYTLRGFTTQVVITRKEVESEFPFQSEILISEMNPVSSADNLGLKGYLEVHESGNSVLCKVRVMRNTHGANNPDIELAELWLDGNSASDYLNKLYRYLSTDEWET